MAISQVTSGRSLNFKKTLWPLFFLWMGFNCLKATATSRRQFTFYHSVPRNSLYSFYRPRKDEMQSRPWSHPVVLNTGPLDWESSTLTTRPLLTLMYSRKSVGPKMEPRGSPALTGYCCEDSPSRTTQSHLLLRKEEKRPNI